MINNTTTNQRLQFYSFKITSLDAWTELFVIVLKPFSQLTLPSICEMTAKNTLREVKEILKDNYLEKIYTQKRNLCEIFKSTVYFASAILFLMSQLNLSELFFLTM